MLMPVDHMAVVILSAEERRWMFGKPEETVMILSAEERQWMLRKPDEAMSIVLLMGNLS